MTETKKYLIDLDRLHDNSTITIRQNGQESTYNAKEFLISALLTIGPGWEIGPDCVTHPHHHQNHHTPHEAHKLCKDERFVIHAMLENCERERMFVPMYAEFDLPAKKLYDFVKSNYPEGWADELLLQIVAAVKTEDIRKSFQTGVKELFEDEDFVDTTPQIPDEEPETPSEEQPETPEESETTETPEESESNEEPETPSEEPETLVEENEESNEEPETSDDFDEYKLKLQELQEKYPDYRIIEVNDVFLVNGNWMTFENENVVLFGNGQINANCNNGSDIACIRVKEGANVVIAGGIYKVGPNDVDNRPNACVLADGGRVIIEDGIFYSENPYNPYRPGDFCVLDVTEGHLYNHIECRGGSFVGQNPADGDDILGGSFVADGYISVVTGTDAISGKNIYSVYPYTRE